MADRRRAGPGDARDHLRPSRDRPLGVVDATHTRPRRWPTTPSPSSTSWRSTASTSTGSRSAAWSPSRSRSATLSGSGRSSSAGRIPAAAGRPFPEPEVVAFFRRRARMPSEEAAWASVPYNYGPRAGAEQVDRIAEDIERRLANPFNERAYRAQLLAASLHNCYGRLDRIRAPTLVVHGARDRIIPRRQRAHDRGPPAGCASCRSCRTPAICIRPRSRRWTRPSASSSPLMVETGVAITSAV